MAIVRKTIGLREPLRAALAPLADDIEYAFVFGSVAAGQDRANSDIDLMVVAHSLDYATCSTHCGPPSKPSIAP